MFPQGEQQQQTYTNSSFPTTTTLKDKNSFKLRIGIVKSDILPTICEDAPLSPLAKKGLTLYSSSPDVFTSSSSSQSSPSNSPRLIPKSELKSKSQTSLLSSTWDNLDQKEPISKLKTPTTPTTPTKKKSFQYMS